MAAVKPAIPDIDSFIKAVSALSSGKSTSNAAKETAIKQFIRRALFADKHEKYESENLPAGSPVYVYCKHCGILIDRLPEDYLFPPYTVCSQCNGLTSQGWMEEAKQKAKVAKMAS